MTSVTSATSASTNTATASNAVDNTMIASNFTTFLQLLTTQLKNQNPLDPLDTNQFTQQLVQFAQVEQQMKSNDQLSALVSLEKSAQATTALAYVGSFAVNPGNQDFSWDGKGNNGTQWPDGNYTMSVTAVDASKQSVAIST